MINYHLVCLDTLKITSSSEQVAIDDGSIAEGIKYFMARRTAFSER